MFATQKTLKRATIVLFLNAFVIVSIAVFSSCTFYADFYLRNYLNENVMVRALLEEPEYDLYKFNFIMKCADGVLKIDDNTEKKLETPIIYNRKEKSVVEFTMRPKSTLLVGSTYNQPHGFETIQWSVDSTMIVNIDASALRRSGGLFPPFHFYYDIKADD